MCYYHFTEGVPLYAHVVSALESQRLAETSLLHVDVERTWRPTWTSSVLHPRWHNNHKLVLYWRWMHVTVGLLLSWSSGAFDSGER